jgi:hypothetical protein
MPLHAQKRDFPRQCKSFPMSCNMRSRKTAAAGYGKSSVVRHDRRLTAAGRKQADDETLGREKNQSQVV